MELEYQEQSTNFIDDPVRELDDALPSATEGDKTW